jgi:23S rRNA (guanosine2251-2'-O)-methyltransferase
MTFRRIVMLLYDFSLRMSVFAKLVPTFAGHALASTGMRIRPGYGERVAQCQRQQLRRVGVQARPCTRVFIRPAAALSRIIMVIIMPPSATHRPRQDRPRQDRPKHERRRNVERARGARHGAREGEHAAVILYGWHSVKAALENPARGIRRLLATENAARRLAAEGVPLAVEPEIVRPDAIARRLSPDAVHNGVLLEADALPSPELEDIAPAGVALLLDQITDPHNVGAILRTAAAFGVAAVIATARHSPEATGVLAKSASGALEHVPIVTVQNLARALASLRERGYLLVGLDSTGEGDLGAASLRAPLALVLGAEGKGLRQLTRASCDQVARLDVPGRIKSLNVSNAAAVALYIATSRLG